MSFEASRLRRGEIHAALAAVVLLVVLLAVPWYGIGGQLGAASRVFGITTTRTGWQALSGVRWLLLVTIVVSLGLVWFQGSRRAPALPSVLSVLVTVLGALSTVALIWRTLISLPYPSPLVGAHVGAYLGLAAAVWLAYGGFRSLREEDRPDPEHNARIPVSRVPE